MKIKNLFMYSFLAMIACSCQEDKDLKPEPTPGKDVTFGVSLEQNSVTRTIYGDEENNAFPIYWVNGDQVLVTSPQCGIKQGTYQVAVSSATQNYANALNKVGDAGVQWGEDATADFYSVYPAAGATAGANYKSFNLSMPAAQDNIIDDNNVVKPGMDACFMYAIKTGVDNGSDVNLAYHPLSTAIRFTIQGPDAATGGTGQDKANIRRIVLHAPVAIAGDFTVDLSDGTPKVTLGSNTSNEIEIDAFYGSTGGNLELGVNEKLELNAFIIPQDGISINNDWYIEITLSNGATYRKNLGANSSTANTSLTAGMIHRLPDLPAFTWDTSWNPGNWMVNIPRNVYLSEISIPGSWNSLNSAFQNSTNIATQYAAGVRAFHIDTRWQSSSTYRPIVGTYCLANSITGTLAVANGGSSLSVINQDGRVMDNSAPSFENTLTAITNEVQSDEYMVVFCTFAQDSYDYDRNNGGWQKAISDVCANNDKVIDAKTITQNTVVGDVLGKVIVIVNSESTVSSLTGITDSKCFFSNVPLTLTANQFASSFSYNEDALYSWKSAWTGSGITLYNTQAQVSSQNTTGFTNSDRGYAPSLTERETIAGNILDWSNTNFSDPNYAHDAWIYLGLGGYFIRSASNDSEVDGSYATVASTLNGWINDRVNNMASRPTGNQTAYYPVGIVLMNYVTNYEDVVNNILQLNNKFKKAADETWNQTHGVQSAAPGYNSGMVDNGTDAFGWTRMTRSR